jgi:hypothetical protein
MSHVYNSNPNPTPNPNPNPNPMPNPLPDPPPPPITASWVHYQAALNHEATAELHRQAAKLYEQHKCEEAKNIAKRAVQASDEANKQSVKACQCLSSSITNIKRKA